MPDHVSQKKRSEIMRSVRSKNTGPERIVRSAAHRLGLRFCLHKKNLPGEPDLVFPKWKTVVFVHGCFWHRHPGCLKAGTPKTNVEFWEEKFLRNVERDAKNQERLKQMGWRVVVIWQCQAKTAEQAENILEEAFSKQYRASPSL